MKKTGAELEVLVTTMHQQDTKKYREMNLQTDAVIANQTDRNFYTEECIAGNCAKLVSTDTRGLSRNRNIALSFSSGKLLLFTDDDVTFYDGYDQLVLHEFREHPEADAIRFEMHVSAIAAEKDVRHPKAPECFRPATRREISRYGICGLVIKKSVLKKHCLHFNEDFGSGTENYCGEDTIFLQQILNRKIRLYLSPTIIASIDKSQSTWFQGFDEKRFYVNGKVLAAAYPRLAGLMAVRSSFKFSRWQKDMGFFMIWKSYRRGIHDYLHS